MEAHFTEWLNLGIRWIHMITGIAWIGASFYFVWLENNLNRSNPREGLSDDFLVVDRSGSGNNCDEHFFNEDELLLLNPHQ